MITVPLRASGQPVTQDKLRFDSSDSTAIQHQPYKSDRTVGGHLLALPSYLAHLTTRPFSYGIKKAEQVVPGLFEGERGDFGVYPLLELGGETGFSYGLLMFHRNLIDPEHNLRLEALFGSSRYNDFDFEYTVNNFLSKQGILTIDATYANTPDRSLFIGNSTSLSDESFFDREDLEAGLKYDYRLTDRLRFQFAGNYVRKRVTESEEEEELFEEDEDDIFQPFPRQLFGTTSLLKTSGRFVWNGARGVPRINRGTRIITDFEFGKSLSNNDFHFVKYGLEVNQFVPVFFLPDSRRLGIKAKVKKAEPLGDKNIPFFELPSLGNADDLRGFETDRFRDSGSLLITAEYRYPIWSFADVVLFVDEGQVFNDYSEIGIKDFHTSYGFGFHLISSKGFALRSEFAFSRETSRFILVISPNF
ncbi:MAG TPA: BamA/TamA family outer membrane protein [Balneolaceae bacterium]|nr:BamA/TamA family outer membrane protein [Balneolaceae bacterium]